MYRLKEKYKDSYVSRQGSHFRLSDVRQDQIEELGLEKYFEKAVSAKKSKKDK